MTTKILLLVIALLLAVIAGLLVSKPTAAPSQPEQADLLSQIREKALDQIFIGPIGQVVFEGPATAFGTDGTFRLALAADGRFLYEVRSDLGEIRGFDGLKGWLVDSSGMPRWQSSNELAWGRMVADVISGRWAAKASPYTLSSSKSGDKIIVDLSDESGLMSAQIYVDADSLRPTLLVRAGGQQHSAIELADYTESNGLTFPRSISIKEAGVSVRSMTVHRMAIGHAIEESLYQAITTRPDDFHFDATAPNEIEVKRTATGHFLIRPRINDQDLGWFILDSGGGVSTISQSAAAKLDLAKIGKIPLVSIFGVVESPIYRAGSLKIGPIAISQPDFTEMDLAPISKAFGVEVEGVIGYPLFARAVVETEAASDRIAIFDPATYALEGGNWQELILDHQHPVIRAKFEGDREGLFRLDIGAGKSTVLFHAPAVQRLKLLDGREITKQMAGQSEIGVGQLEWFELAGHRFENLKAAFALSDIGPFGDPFAVGNIGGGVLTPFKVVFDYTNSRIALIETSASK